MSIIYPKLKKINLKNLFYYKTFFSATKIVKNSVFVKLIITVFYFNTF